MSAPEVVPASFFRRPSFLTDFATVASRCVFHVRGVSRVTSRKFGLSTCGTGMFSSFSITFSFTVESEKSVACVLLQFISMHHSFAQELTLLMVSCMTCVAVEVFGIGPCSQVINMKGICDSRWEGVDNVIYVQKEHNLREDTSLRDSLTSLDLSAVRSIKLHSGHSVVEKAADPSVHLI